MERRNFLRMLFGSAVAPSLVWPFRKIFLPPAIIEPTLEESFWYGTGAIYDNPNLQLAAVETIELEYFAKRIPNLIHRGSALYNYFKKDPTDLICKTVELTPVGLLVNVD